MTKKELVKHLEEFAKSMLPILNEIFEKENWNKLEIDKYERIIRDGYLYLFSKDGKALLWIDRKNIKDYENIGVRYKDVIIEHSRVNLMEPLERYRKSSRSYVIDNNYFINNYVRNVYKQNKCLFCNWEEKDNFHERYKQKRTFQKHMKTHNLTKSHSKNREMFMNDFARMTRLNYDVVKNIVSFL